MNFCLVYIFPLSLILSKLVELTNYNEHPVTQLLLSDNKTQLTITGTKSFSYQAGIVNFEPNSFNESPFLSSDPSLQIKQLKDGTVAIACNSIGVNLVTESSQQIARYNLDIINKEKKCSFLQLSSLKFLLVFSFQSVYYIHFIKYDAVITGLIKEDSFTFPKSTETLISCELFELNEIVFCVYLNNYVRGYYFRYDDYTTLGNIDIDYNYMNPMKMIKVNEENIGLFILNITFIQGYIYHYKESIEKIELTIESKALFTPSMKYEVFDIKSIDIITDYSQMSTVLIAIACNRERCFFAKYTLLFEELIPLIEIPLIFNASGSHLGVSLGLFNEFLLSIVITQNNGNYLGQYNVNVCLSKANVFHATNVFFFKTISRHSSGVKIVIIESTSELLHYLSLHLKKETIEENIKYSLNELKFTPAKGGNYTMKYQLLENGSEIKAICLIKFTICYRGCKTCFEYGNESSMGCLECDQGYYSSESEPSHCFDLHYRKCGSESPYWAEKEMKCVSSCDAYNLNTDKEDYLCLSECTNGKILNKIEKKCLFPQEFNRNMDKYITELNKYVLDLHTHCPKQRKENYTINIYETSRLPNKYSLEPVSFDNTSFNITYLSTVNLNRCEEILKKRYEIDSGSPLLIVQFDSVVDTQITHNVKYSVFSSNGTALNLTICENTPIEIVTPIINTTMKYITLSQSFSRLGINIFNSTDRFFNDICFPFTSDEKTDIPLPIRHEEYYINNEVLCNLGCEYKSLDYEKLFVVCSCFNGANYSYSYQYSLFKNQSLSFSSRSNLGIVKCSNLLFHDGALELNFGGFIVLCLIIIQIINSVYFWLQGVKLIRIALLRKIKTKALINFSKSQNHQLMNNSSLQGVNSSIFVNNNNQNSIDFHDNSPLNFKKNILNINNNNQTRKVLANSQDINKFDRNYIQNQKVNPPMMITSNLELRREKELIFCFNKTIEQQNPRYHSNRKRTNLPQINKVFKENNLIIIPNQRVINSNQNNPQRHKSSHSQNSVNDSYNLKRQYYVNDLIDIPNTKQLSGHLTFHFFYFSFLQNLQPITSTFFLKNVCKIRIIKISVFVFFLVLTITLNTLLFSVRYINHSYYSPGKLNLVYNLPKVINAFCIRVAMKVLFNFLSSPMSVIYDIKNNRYTYTSNKKNDLIKELNNKLKVYFTLQWILLAFCWYYVSVFCAVYPNIQLTWIICSVIGFIIEQLFPFLLCALLALLSLINSKYHRQWIRFLTLVLSMMS